jgi:hypothetical protein
MGHEYVEMKNSHAAIEAYRRAVGALSFSMTVGSNEIPDCLTSRRKSKRLPGLVWSGTGLRTSEHASIRFVLLSTCHRITVGLLRFSCGTSSSFSLVYEDRMMFGYGKHRACATRRSEGIYIRKCTT